MASFGKFGAELAIIGAKDLEESLAKGRHSLIGNSDY